MLIIVLLFHSDQVQIAEVLIKHGVMINHRDSYGCTALHRAAEHSNSHFEINKYEDFKS